PASSARTCGSPEHRRGRHLHERGERGGREMRRSMSADDEDTGTTTSRRVIVIYDMMDRNGRSEHHNALTPRQAEELADREARRILDVSRDEAFQMLDSGELE